VIIVFAGVLGPSWAPLIRSPVSRRDDVLAIARGVEELARPEQAVLFMPSRRREWLLSFPSLYGELRDIALQRGPVESDSLAGVESDAAAVGEQILHEQSILALQDPPEDPVDGSAVETIKREFLRRYFDPCRVVDRRGARLVVYAQHGRCHAYADRPPLSANDVHLGS
jgi:mannosyltransferase